MPEPDTQLHTPRYYGVPRDTAESIRLHYRAKKPGITYHYHPQFELVMVRGSFGKRLVGACRSSYDDPDATLLGPNLPHVWLADPLVDPEGVMDYHVIHFDRESLGLEFLAKPELTPVRNLLKKAERGFALTDAAAKKQAGNLFQRIFSTEGLERLLAFYSLLLLMCRSEHVQLLVADPHAVPPSDREYELFHRAVAFIHDHSKRRISLGEIAEHMHMSIPAFTRFFRKISGTSFVAYLNDWRIQRACRLLTETDLPIIRISMQVGYDNLSHFNRQFRKVTGTTPTAYRSRNA